MQTTQSLTSKQVQELHIAVNPAGYADSPADQIEAYEYKKDTRLKLLMLLHLIKSINEQGYKPPRNSNVHFAIKNYNAMSESDHELLNPEITIETLESEITSLLINFQQQARKQITESIKQQNEERYDAITEARSFRGVQIKPYEIRQESEKHMSVVEVQQSRQDAAINKANTHADGFVHSQLNWLERVNDVVHSIIKN